jgi:NAD(P)-dependent dehydrogenase (short-subunit alcohol dehydrogenase family)
MTEHRGEPRIQELFDLTGQVALITGGSGYLGGAMARAVAEAGATVIVSSRELGRAESVRDELVRHTNRAHFAVELNHLEGDSVDKGFDAAASMCRGIDILVNNGQFTIGKDWTTVSADEFTQQMANASGYFTLARRMRDHAVARNRPASIVLLGSMYGMVGSYPDTYSGVVHASPVAYHTLKAGIIHLTRHLAVYWAKDRIRVNCLSPGPFPASTIPEELARRLSERCPLNRMGLPHELKGALVFLASSASSYVTGHNLVVDGGWTAW